MVPVTSQANFLKNGENKSCLIQRLMKRFRAESMSVFRAEEVTDTIKVSKALKIAKQGEIAVIVGKDIDLLVLLTAQSSNVKNAFPLKSGKGETP